MDSDQVELLAPAGSYEGMTAAVCAGADAVYLGGRLFGARAYADNLDEEQLKRAIDYAHLHRKRLYLTVNTLLKEEELEDKLYGYLKPLYKQGLDAVIVQDIGVLKLVREYFPQLAIHASTQMSLTGVHGAKLMKSMGARRIVTARELSLEEIAEIHDKTDLEIESFVHGALCYCYSGQCLFSSIAGGRSGNRGRCAQPCRLPYQVDGKQRYYLSPKDLCTIGFLPELIKAGVYSLKIEGRMKKPEYTAGVVSVYRKYLDRYLFSGKECEIAPEDKKLLFDIYNRGGFTDGYYHRHNGKDMMFFQGREGETPDKKELLLKEELFDKIRRDYILTEKKEKLSGTATVRKGSPARLCLEYGGVRAEVLGEMAEEAKKQPLDEEKIRKQMEKLGNTPFVWETLTVDTDRESFLTVTALNELRRSAVEELTEKFLLPYRREDARAKSGEEEQDTNKDKKEKPFSCRLNVYLEKTQYIDVLLPLDGIDDFYLDSCVFDLPEITEAVKKNQKKDRGFYYALPHIFRKAEAQWFDSIYDKLPAAGITGFLVKNYDEIGYLKEKGCGLPIRFDYTVYAYNKRTRKAWKDDTGAELFTLPVELNEKELRELAFPDGELIVYGRLPMMVSAQCLRKNTTGCTQKAGLLTITDRYKNEFPVKNQCRFCYNKIYNCKPISLLTNTKEVAKLSPKAVRLDFTTESSKEAAEIASRFLDAQGRVRKLAAERGKRPARRAEEELFCPNTQGCTRKLAAERGKRPARRAGEKLSCSIEQGRIKELAAERGKHPAQRAEEKLSRPITQGRNQEEPWDFTRGHFKRGVE